MKLRYITCSDPRENLNPQDVVDLLKTYPIAELGVQVHKPNMEFGNKRFVWFDKLLEIAKKSETPINIAIHINYEWCGDMCSGKIPDEITYFMKQKHSTTGKNLISRIQLNHGDFTFKFDAQKLSRLISDFRDYEFILPFNHVIRGDVSDLRKTDAQFNVLFDESYGAGVPPVVWKKPAFWDKQFGYAGGISPYNVTTVLGKISNILPQNYQTWIDAEGQLRDKTSGVMDLNLAREYLRYASNWYNDYEK